MVNYTLNYFNGRGRAEISRLIFAAAGIEFTDNRITDWPTTKSETPLGQVPYLTIDDFKLPQSLSIARYLAREHNLVGKNNLEAAKADAIVDTCVDLMTGFYYKVFLVTDLSSKDAALQRFLGDDALSGLEKLEKLIKSYGANSYSVGNDLTWADLFIFDITLSLLNYKASILQTFPHILKVRESVEKNERIANYLKKRPETTF